MFYVSLRKDKKNTKNVFLRINLS